MNFLASLIDDSLFLLFGLTLALVVYKTLGLTRLSSYGLVDGEDLDAALERWEGGMTLLALIASTGPFVGLAGTVLHIIQALHSMSSSSLDISLIAGPIATALNSTLMGLASAVPASVAYSLLQRRIQVLHNRGLRALRGEH